MKNKQTDYEQKILDVDEIQGTDIKINPDFYIHTAILNAQKALNDENLDAGLIKRSMAIEEVEIFSRSANMLDDDYPKELKKFTDSDEYKNSSRKRDKLANKKLELLMNRIFKSKPIADSLRLG